jgi:glycine/D-amino acid oxidase-like deaminating enzyme
MPHPTRKLTIIGGGIIGALEAYLAFLEAKKNSQQVRVTIQEESSGPADSTSARIVPSLTPDEILSVVPRGQQLVEKLKLRFNQPGGIRVDDVEGVNNSATADEFKQQVVAYSQDEVGHAARTKTLLDLGKKSMDLWQEIYDTADDELKAILMASNFNPCREPSDDNARLHDGYRIDLIYNIANARAKALAMKEDYNRIGYSSCRVLSPTQVQALDPFLSDFCASHSEIDANGAMQWRDDAVALWRPGGCLDSFVFLPKFYDYLRKVMGEYKHQDGTMRSCFQIKFARKVEEVIFSNESNVTRVGKLKFFGNPAVTPDTNIYQRKDYVFCPGQAVGTLRRLGFEEPSYAGFAGAVLKLEIPLNAEQIEAYKSFNHCMEVHQEGVVLAWQARFHENKIIIGVGGTKAFYGDQAPRAEQEFARDRNMLQLNMINTVLPNFISIALGKDTHNQELTEQDLIDLQSLNIASRWAGTRAVAYDGFPTLGRLVKDGSNVVNARATTHFGSGGVSFGPAGVVVSRAADEEKPADELTQQVLEFSRPTRRM